MERCMQPQSIVRRVERLEERVTSLEALPGRIDDLTLQVSQLREEMRGEFSAVRAEMREMGDGLRADMREMAGDLRADMRELDEETKRHMLVLHEEVIARLAILQDGANGRKRVGTPRSRRK
jgi:hypothetical protein